MPALSTFFGIIVYMYKESGGKHSIPHIHAEYGDDNAVYDFDGNIIEGDIPKAKQKLVEAWIEIHKEELSANWVLLGRGEQFFKIDPLK